MCRGDPPVQIKRVLPALTLGSALSTHGPSHRDPVFGKPHVSPLLSPIYLFPFSSSALLCIALPCSARACGSWVLHCVVCDSSRLPCVVLIPNSILSFVCAGRQHRQRQQQQQPERRSRFVLNLRAFRQDGSSRSSSRSHCDKCFNCALYESCCCWQEHFWKAGCSGSEIESP